jgi:hypothetical protein
LKSLICLLTYLLRAEWGEARIISVAELARAATVVGSSDGLAKKSCRSLKIGRSVSGTNPRVPGRRGTLRDDRVPALQPRNRPGCRKETLGT